ncbi:MAG: serine/threonine-protein kinase [Baekduia sp.]
MLQAGTIVAGYRIEGLLGAGGMGVVYEATQLSLKRTVALKILASHLSADPGFRRRFRREGEIQAALDHPHIITVYEAGEAEAGLFLAMRLVRGTTLKERFRDGLSLTAALDLLEQTADALNAAHEVGLIHRDVKPQNVLVAAGEHAYLADFGLTKSAQHSDLTQSGHVLGTIDYISPEQVRDDDVASASDVYALGAVLYEAATGSVPFPKSSDAAVLMAHLNDPPPRVTAVRPDLPAALDDVVARAMAKQAADRHKSAAALTGDARAALAGAGEAAGRVVVATLRGRYATIADSWDVSYVPTVADTIVSRAPTVADTVSGELAETSDEAIGPVGRRRLPSRIAALLAVIVAAGLGGFALQDQQAPAARKPPAPASKASTARGSIIVTHPRTWHSSAATPHALDLGVAEQVRLVPSRGEGAFVGGVTTAVDGDLVPVALSRRATTKPSRERVAIGRYSGYRVAGLRIAGLDARVTLYLVPTTGGVAALECYGSGSVGAGCPEIAASVTLRGVETGALGPDPRLATAAADAMRALNATRTTWRRRLHDASTGAALATSARTLRDAYNNAAARVAGADVTPEATPSRERLRAALSAAASAYGRLAVVAAGHHDSAYDPARVTVRRCESRVNAEVRDLGRRGYRVA